MLLKKLLFAFVVCSLSLPAVAQEDELMLNEGVQSFQQDKESWRRQEEIKSVLPRITDSIGQAAIDNIVDSEQLFCYEVAPKPNDYKGYTLDGLMVTGFCGVLNNEIKNLILNDLFMNKDNVVFDKNEDCVIKPRVMLRFVRGIDATDVMLSSPCHSFTIFYGGRLRIYNAKPAAEVVDALVNSLEKNRSNFVSPALLNQLLPIGVAQTQEQKDLVNKTPKPIRNWDTDSKDAEAKKPASGWNNLKF